MSRGFTRDRALKMYKAQLLVQATAATSQDKKTPELAEIMHKQQLNELRELSETGSQASNQIFAVQAGAQKKVKTLPSQH
eukprot:gene25983-34583_t